MDPREWSTPAGVPTPERSAFSVILDRAANENEPTKQRVRNRVTASWRWGGATPATALWHTTYYRGDLVAMATAADDGIALLTVGAPVAAASTISLENFAIQGAAIRQGWRFMIWDAPEIYTVSAPSSVSQAVQIIDDGSSGFMGWVRFDASTGKVYWSNLSTDNLKRCDLDGGNVETLASPASIEGIDLDLSAGHIYYTDRASQKVIRCDLDGGNSTDILTGTGADIRGIALDVANGFLYYCDKGNTKIVRSTLAGASVTDVVTGLTDPYDIALDVAAGYIYWTESSTLEIKRATLAGASPTLIYTDAVSNNIYGLAIDTAGGIIFYGTNDDDIRLTTTAGVGIEEIVDLDNGNGVAYDSTQNRILFTVDGAQKLYIMPAWKETTALLEVTPAISAAAAALGAAAPVYFLVPQNGDGQRSSGDGSLQTIELDEEFTTVYQDADQPEDYPPLTTATTTTTTG